ncbi:MAG: hypothetical protein DRJ97_04385 [Thermoprotei archaeon]|nr:MAG: hypothetical protein DRJ97_04385 [Thermoprotei archaeon]
MEVAGIRSQVRLALAALLIALIVAQFSAAALGDLLVARVVEERIPITKTAYRTVWVEERRPVERWVEETVYRTGHVWKEIPIKVKVWFPPRYEVVEEPITARVKEPVYAVKRFPIY